MQFPIIIGLHRSFFLHGALGLVALFASGIIAAYPGPPVFKVLVLLAVCMMTGLAWSKLKPACRRLRLERDGRLSIEVDPSTGFMSVLPLGGAVVHPWLSVVRLQDDSGRTVVLIAVADSMAADDFRRLRIFLRWRAKFSGDVDV